MLTDEHDPIRNELARIAALTKDVYETQETANWQFFIPRTCNSDVPDQGWKIHLSSDPSCAAEMARKVSMLLSSRNLYWKAAKNTGVLMSLNSTPSPLRMLGKFITIYPPSGDNLQDLVESLAICTEQFSGPVIPTDARYCDTAPVYMRYGSFVEPKQYDPDEGILTSYIIAPDGSRQRDERRVGHYKPEWLSSPVSFPQRANAETLASRGIKVQRVIQQSLKGGVYRATIDGMNVILKEARHHTNPDTIGRDARMRLKNEETILRRLANFDVAPQVLDYFVMSDNHYLVTTLLPGVSLRTDADSSRYQASGSPTHIIAICDSLQGLVKTIHREGIAIRDLSPNNIIVHGDSCFIVDFELSHSLDDSTLPFHGYTPGYVMPGSITDRRTEPVHDLFALGCTMFFAITGVQPFAMRPELLDRSELESIGNAFISHTEIDTLAPTLSRAIELIETSLQSCTGEMGRTG
ncbi:MAG: hypothetical protein QM753_13085 [Thermomicrobiales bacterium]